MCMGNWVRTIKAYILNIIDYDIILRKDWLFDVNLHID